MKTINSKNFILKKEYLGKGFTIIVEQGFRYNHDDLFKNQQHRFLKGGSASHSWTTYGEYTKTSGYPAWANDFVSFDKEINPPEDEKMVRNYARDLDEEIASITKKGEAKIRNSPNVEDLELKLKKFESDLKRLRIAIIALFILIASILYVFW